MFHVRIGLMEIASRHSRMRNSLKQHATRYKSFRKNMADAYSASQTKRAKTLDTSIVQDIIHFLRALKIKAKQTRLALAHPKSICIQNYHMQHTNSTFGKQ